MGLCGVWLGGGGGCGVASCGADDGGEGAGGAVGDGDAEGDLVHVLLVEGLEVEGLVELFLEAGRGVGEQVAEDGEGVEQRGAPAACSSTRVRAALARLSGPPLQSSTISSGRGSRCR